MAFPLVYDVLMRIQIEARDKEDALQTIAENIASLGIDKTVTAGFEVIRDDNSFPPKDNHSRHTNGFAVFTSEQKINLLATMAAALESARRGDAGPGEALMKNLAEQFAYLENSELKGVKV